MSEFIEKACYNFFAYEKNIENSCSSFHGSHLYAGDED